MPLTRINSDAMANVQLADGTLVRRSEQHAARVLGKPRRAQVLQVFEPRNGATLDTIQAEAEARASTAGWNLARRSPMFLEGTKAIDGLNVELTIYRGESAPELVVLLRQQ